LTGSHCFLFSLFIDYLIEPLIWKDTTQNKGWRKRNGQKETERENDYNMKRGQLVTQVFLILCSLDRGKAQDFWIIPEYSIRAFLFQNSEWGHLNYWIEGSKERKLKAFHRPQWMSCLCLYQKTNRNHIQKDRLPKRLSIITCNSYRVKNILKRQAIINS
jgi:hypothetical protein